MTSGLDQRDLKLTKAALKDFLSFSSSIESTKLSGILSWLSDVFRFAPFKSKSFVIRRFSDWTARCKGLQPSRFWALSSAPRLIKNRAAEAWLCIAATWRGVLPRLSYALTSASNPGSFPASSKMILSFPFSAATCSKV